MHHLIISTSRSPRSRSRVICDLLQRQLGTGAEVTLLDAVELDLPHCDNDETWSHPGTKQLQQAIEAADGVVIGLGIYNYAPAATAKTVVELGNQAWHEKVVALAATAGGDGSLLAVTDLASSLMLDFQCLIVPRFVYATSEAFESGAVVDDRIHMQIDELAGGLRRLVGALAGGDAQGVSSTSGGRRWGV